ncbi:MAG: hypothetical protein V3U93_04480 [Alphaproteobacteria bacterium]
MFPHDLMREWLALPSPGAGDLRLLGRRGVTREAVHWAGGLAIARIGTTGRLWMPSPTGAPAFILPVWAGPAPSIYSGVENPVLIDMIAWRPDDLARWWYRLGEVEVDLGADHLDLAHVEGWPISLHRTPLDWLRADCRGAVLLDHCEARWTGNRLREADAESRAWWEDAA